MTWALWISKVPLLRKRLMVPGQLGTFVRQCEQNYSWVFWDGGKSVLVLRLKGWTGHFWEGAG